MGSCEQALIRGFPNGETHLRFLEDRNVTGRREPPGGVAVSRDQQRGI